jgi:hypothetical protein
VSAWLVTNVPSWLLLLGFVVLVAGGAALLTPQMLLTM